jgi:hypothetical protein
MNTEIPQNIKSKPSDLEIPLLDPKGRKLVCQRYISTHLFNAVLHNGPEMEAT